MHKNSEGHLVLFASLVVAALIKGANILNQNIWDCENKLKMCRGL